MHLSCIYHLPIGQSNFPFNLLISIIYHSPNTTAPTIYVYSVELTANKRQRITINSLCTVYTVQRTTHRSMKCALQFQCAHFYWLMAGLKIVITKWVRGCIETFTFFKIDKSPKFNQKLTQISNSLHIFV